MTDRYAADRVLLDAPLLTPTHRAIRDLWAALRYRVSDERLCLQPYRQADGRPVGYLAQLSEADGQRLLEYLQDQQAADTALATQEAQP